MPYKLKLVYYGRADLVKFNREAKRFEDVDVVLSTPTTFPPIIVAFPCPEGDDYIAVYEVE